jgi:DNA (cytosine-5)-methyltransferase 1
MKSYPGLISIDEAAHLLGLSKWTLRKWDNEGKLKAVKINDRGWRMYRPDDIKNFLEKL